MDSVYDLRSKRRLFVDKDIRLSDSVRNTPTAATPPQPLPQPPQDKEPAGLAEIRAKFFELSDRVTKLYDDDKDKAIAKDVRSDVLGGKHVRFRAKESDKGRIGDLIRRQKREFEKARLGVEVFDFNDQHVRVHPAVNQFLYDVVSLVVEPSSLASLVLGGQCSGPAVLRASYGTAVSSGGGMVDPRPLLEEEHRLVVENDTEDWTPAADSRRRNMFRALDRAFYKTLVDKYLVPEALAAVPLPTLVFEIVEVYLAWEDQKGDDVETPHPTSMRYSGADQAGGQGDDVDGKIRQLLQQNIIANKRIADLEALVHGRTDGMSKPTTRRLGGFRPGMPDTGRRVAFDPKDRKAKPPCPRCGPGQYHGWWQCPEGGARPGPDGGSQCAVHAPTKREVKTLALCKLFDEAAEQGPRAFEACMQRFGEPVLLAGERALPDTQRDVSAFGFAVGDRAPQVRCEDSGTDDEDAEADLSFQQVSHLPAAPQTSGAGPLYAGGDGLHYPALPGGSVAVSAPLGANALALAGGACEDYDSSEADEEFDRELAACGAAGVPDEVVAAAPAVGGRASGVGRSALASYMPKWLLVTTMLLCVTAVGALQVSGGSRSGGALPAGLDSGVPLRQARVRLVADGTRIYPNPPYDSPSPPPLQVLAGTPTLLPDAGLMGVQAELEHQQLWDAVRRLELVVRQHGGVAHGTLLGGTQRSRVPEIEDEDEDEDGDAAAAGAEPTDEEI
ncbi:hypothetical protein CYMTET_39502 [Cymbomonas tetramitiformis]|uniref:Uncharacterized protein n=1 Tax=Cymbomonas tetramitiformis TaxID=36881 RepID=A0AAE0CBL8_9CHLO|nr:hypothetical protein CYMTET_39502 [Cymbomonas tetramitiformis]